MATTCLSSHRRQDGLDGEGVRILSSKGDSSSWGVAAFTPGSMLGVIAFYRRVISQRSTELFEAIGLLQLLLHTQAVM